MEAPTLLFVHGASFCKEIWGPVERRLKQSPLLQRMPEVQFTSMDLPYHGTNRDDSVVAVVDQAAADVEHPVGNWVAWSSDAVLHQVQLLRTKDGSCDPSKPTKRRPIIGIGHSMGASALWNVEAQNPGTFDALVLFEPISEDPRKRNPVAHRYMFSTTMKRENRWYAVRFFETMATTKAPVLLFAHGAGFCKEIWEPIIRRMQQSPLLQRTLDVEFVSLDLPYHGTKRDDSEPAQVDAKGPHQEQVHNSCVTTFHSGSRSKLFDQETFLGIMRRCPEIYKIRAPMPGKSHVMVLEDPAGCAEAILTDLEELNCLKPRASRL
ncbi:hypothetical protein BBJ28_00010439 [Nothophytophthora sp. Chile5]|nr:hypothetical protein BBJ28_00010439 [Nothophytophthora sp. Chile5]